MRRSGGGLSVEGSARNIRRLNTAPEGGRIEDACGEVTGHPDRNNAKPWSLTCWLVGWSVPGRRLVEDKFGLERGQSRSSWTSVLPMGVVGCHFGAPRGSFAQARGSKVATTGVDEGKEG